MEHKTCHSVKKSKSKFLSIQLKYNFKFIRIQTFIYKIIGFKIQLCLSIQVFFN